MTSRTSIFLLGVGIVCASLAVMAQAADPHLTADPAKNLYRSSAFLHGYIHGYESGFHRGDLDLHLNREPQEAAKPQAGDVGYRSEFGDRRIFERGFREGSAAGYGDAWRGSAFRGVAQVRRLAETIAPDVAARKDFDEAILAGYQAGWQEGRKRPLTSAELRGSERACLAAHSAPPYCDAYGRGFGLGYADGSLSPPLGKEAQTAQARDARAK